MRFFKTKPKKGMPITIDGFSRGLRLMARALEKMEVQDGSVEWSFGIPRLIFEGGGTAGIFNHPFKVSLVKVEDDDDYLTVSKGRLHFWNGDEWKIEPEEIGKWDDWTVPTDTGGAYTAEYIYAQFVPDRYHPWDQWSLGHGTTNPQDAGSNQDDQEQRTWIIAKLETDGSIDQRINQDIYETMGG